MHIILKNGYSGCTLKHEKYNEDDYNLTKYLIDFIKDEVICEGDVIMVVPDDEIE